MEGFLTLTRRPHDTTTLTLQDGREIVIKVEQKGMDGVKLSIKAPPDVKIVRGEAKRRVA